MKKKEKKIQSMKKKKRKRNDVFQIENCLKEWSTVYNDPMLQSVKIVQTFFFKRIFNLKYFIPFYNFLLLFAIIKTHEKYQRLTTSKIKLRKDNFMFLGVEDNYSFQLT